HCHVRNPEQRGWQALVEAAKRLLLVDALKRVHNAVIALVAHALCLQPHFDHPQRIGEYRGETSSADCTENIHIDFLRLAERVSAVAWWYPIKPRRSESFLQESIRGEIN